MCIHVLKKYFENHFALKVNFFPKSSGTHFPIFFFFFQLMVKGVYWMKWGARDWKPGMTAKGKGLFAEVLQAEGIKGKEKGRQMSSEEILTVIKRDLIDMSPVSSLCIASVAIVGGAVVAAVAVAPVVVVATDIVVAVAADVAVAIASAAATCETSFTRRWRQSTWTPAG